MKRFIAAYPRDLEQAYTAEDVVRIHKTGKVGSLIGIEGGHQMGHSFAAHGTSSAHLISRGLRPVPAGVSRPLTRPGSSVPALAAASSPG